MPNLLQGLISTFSSLLLAPVVLFLCLTLFPFAVFTTYFAFVALTVRAALVHAQVAAALIRHWLRLEDDYSAASSWAPKAKKEELELYQRHYVPKRHSFVNAGRAPGLNVKIRTQSDANTIPFNSTVTSDELSAQKDQLSSDSSTISPPNSRGPSRPPSLNSPMIARDYEGVGGWYPFPSSTPGPAPESASLEWLVSNARLELPDADAASLTRPRTPEDVKRSSSISGRSHRSMTSLQRKNHQRSATAGSIEAARSDENTSLQSSSSRASSQLERSRSQAHISEPEALIIGGRKIEEGKIKSMIFFGEKGSKLAGRLAGLKSLGLKKKPKGELSSPEESTGEDAKHQFKELEHVLASKQRKTVNYDLAENNSNGGSGPGSVDGAESSGLSMWMRP